MMWNERNFPTRIGLSQFVDINGNKRLSPDQCDGIDTEPLYQNSSHKTTYRYDWAQIRLNNPLLGYHCSPLRVRLDCRVEVVGPGDGGMLDAELEDASPLMIS